MHLLKLEDNATVSLVAFAKHSIPRYAILSHTWGREDEEVSYKDVKNGTGSSKAGYQKLLFCGNQARSNDIYYFWVDTCCIDKSDSSELQRSINSMFRWYRDASRCYVYLSDVSQDTLEWKSAFRNSRWFKRGWTLQELIAPKIVQFYSKNQVFLGDKITLEQQITEISGIPKEALQGHSLSNFSIAERFRWAETRETSEEEDNAYCLFGIFDVFLPLIYGEGQANAIRRLQKEIDESAERKGTFYNNEPFLEFSEKI
jgi:hypothetical protein